MFLELHQLRKMYDQENGVRQLDLEVKQGEFITLLGPSGCGKTTVLNLIGGFLRADSGRILLDGQDITNLPPEERPISTVFQSYALFPHMNVLDNVCYGLRFFRRLSKKEALPRAYEYLEIVGLKGYETQSIQKLSGGQQQRVALARSMVIQPKLLLLDEPLSNLDAGLRVRMREELKELQRKLDITMLFVTHDQEEALSLSDRIVLMEKGEVRQIGTPEEIYHHPNSPYSSSFMGESNFLEDPQGIHLLRPEDIIMEADPTSPHQVIDRTFMGSHTVYRVRYNQQILTVDAAGSSQSTHQPGDRVALHFGRSSQIPNESP